MKFLWIAALGFSLSAEAIPYSEFRKQVLAAFSVPTEPTIFYKYYKGFDTHQSQVDCHLQLKVAPNMTTLYLEYPTSEQQGVQVAFASSRPISKSGNKFSSHFIGCSGDPYECWDYDHYSLTLDAQEESVIVTMQGHSCRFTSTRN